MRSFKTAFPAPMLDAYQAGVMRYTYKGIRCLKSPLDIAIYMRVLWDLKPRLIVEIGSHSGGSALLFADLADMMGLDTRIVSVDLATPEGVTHPRVQFVEGNVLDLEPVFETHALFGIPHPWFVTEDSAHSYDGCLRALCFFDRHMRPGDILAMEDGVLDELGLSAQYQGGPNRAIQDFFATTPGQFEIALEYCDMFGQNATYNPNGYLKKL
ncbi:CmcI family methyltransferase [Aestuariivita sp.]|jgi:cephalosporin hydroxylase|uniref:CmcI family methyltransferase n=1 Tax=Aestuariivita sp. TaxID=1872407 RepID=UPI002172CBE7|nr:CmcI family methyltransferase [Aestuariivita sp.]MCE8008761.1 cephalosporin hydroxylase [Aestuariivita sp.]